MEGHVLISDGIRYREAGAGNPVILILPGGGESFDVYFPLQDELSKNQNVRILLVDLLNLISNSATVIPLERWGNLLNEFIAKVIGKNKFILLAHSMGTLVAAQYLRGYANEKDDRCKGVIFFNSGLAHCRIQYLIISTIFRILRLIQALPTGMEWMENKISFRTSCTLMDDGYGIIPLGLPCIIILGRKDPYKNLLTGWKRLTPVKTLIKDSWDHSPQKRKLPELIRVVRKIVSEITPSL